MTIDLWLIQGYIGRNVFWLRFLSRGFAFDRHAPLFSERYGYKTYVRVFGWRIKGLT